MGFLRLCDLPPYNNYHQRLCGAGGYNLFPSNVPGTSGCLFLSKVSRIIHNPPSELPTALQVGIEDLICDMNYDHRADLVAHGIRELLLDGKRLVVRCLSGTSQAADLRTYLDSMLDLCDVNIEFRFVELATATALNLTGTQ